MKEELDSGGVLSASSARIAYDYSAGNTAYTARQRLADTDSMAEEQESPRARLDTSSTHLRRRVEIGCKTRVGVKWVEPGFNPLLWCPCERGWAEYETNTIVQSADA